MESLEPTCPRHPDVETRLRCWSCDDLICPSCAHEAPSGYKCPACAGKEGEEPRSPFEPADRDGLLSRLTSDRGPAPSRPTPRPDSSEPTPPMSTNVRATAIGVAAAVVGGLVLGPVLVGGTFFLISAGVVGWGVARAVYWASQERNSSYLRAMALTLAGVTVAIGMSVATTPANQISELAFLAFPAAIYGGWIVVRQR